MDERQRRAWRALELGPAWRPRVDAVAAPDPAPADVPAFPQAPAAADPASAEALRLHEPAPTIVAAVPDQAIAVAADAKRARWDALKAQVPACELCGLCRTRTKTVFGVGSEQASWMLIGEAPGAEEDARGEPFVGQAGRLLDNMLSAMGLTRAEDVYIANVLKCRPPGNRNPTPEEVACCEPYLKAQVELVAPRLIVLMGRFAAQSLLQTDASIASLRQRVHRYEVAGRSVPVVVTYHPAYLLRNLEDKSKAWADLLFARHVDRLADI